MYLQYLRRPRFKFAQLRFYLVLDVSNAYDIIIIIIIAFANSNDRAKSIPPWNPKSDFVIFKRIWRHFEHIYVVQP